MKCNFKLYAYVDQFIIIYSKIFHVKYMIERSGRPLKLTGRGVYRGSEGSNRAVGPDKK